MKRMNKNAIMWIAAATIALSGCSDDEIANMGTSEQNTINFNVVGNNAGTKAQPTTSTNITQTRFDVFAFIHGQTGQEALFMGKHETDGKHKGVEFYYSNGWQYAKNEDKAYWPVQALDFYAIKPSVNEHIQLYSATCDGSDHKIEYEIIDEFDKDETRFNQDVMYATAFNQTKSSNNGTVQLQFHHALTQVVFKAKTELADMEVTIGNVKIHNIKSKGKFTIPTDGAVSQDSWELDNLTSPNSFHLYKNEENITVNSNDVPVWISNVDETTPDNSRVTILHPQKADQWNTETTKTITAADEAKQCYLSIECNIKQRGKTLFCNEAQDGEEQDLDSFGTIYMPLSADWNPGIRYIYTLTFGGGFDADGNQILEPVKVDAEADEWTTYDPEHPEA